MGRHVSMNIYAPSGTLIYVTPESSQNGYDGDVAKVKKYLEVGQEYTVDHTEPDGSRTDVYVKEVPGIPFNSVNFMEYDYDLPFEEDEFAGRENEFQIKITGSGTKEEVVFGLKLVIQSIEGSTLEELKEGQEWESDALVTYTNELDLTL